MPRWLADRMARLGRVIVETLVLEYGAHEVLRRLANPFWFQSFGAVMGMDWHSSGITTSVLGALRKGLAPVEWELGVHVRGGKGAASRRTPAELTELGEQLGREGETWVRASKLTAKVDSAAVQDGFDLYLHGFVTTDDGAWTVVQQGMRVESREARRYHWLSEGLSSFVDAPHAAIDGPGQGEIVNLADARARPARDAQLTLVQGGPEAVLDALPQARPAPAAQPLLPFLQLPAHHDVREEDVVMRRLRGTLAAAREANPGTFEDLLLTPGVGRRTVFALASVAELIHGAPCRFTDPARFSFAHGGKDRHPYAVPLKVYDQTLRVLKAAVERARLGNDDRLQALRALDAQARGLEARAEGPEFQDCVREERAASHSYGGMSVLGPEPHPESTDAFHAPSHARAEAAGGHRDVPSLRTVR